MELEPWKDLSGKVVMVTGASSGIGKDLCLNLAKAGCLIVAAARRIDRLVTLCDHINQLGSVSGHQISAAAVELDVCADEPAVEAAISKAWKAFGRIDTLISNAGIRGSVHTPFDLSQEEWDNVIKTNMRGNWLVAKYVCMQMRDAKQKGSVIFMSSISGLDRTIFHGSFIYSTSKVALAMMAKSMAIEFGEYNIKVNTVSPGLFESEITKELMQKPWLKNFARRTFALRILGPIDPALTELIRYLIHDSSDYVSGNNFIVDSGATLHGYPIFPSLL